METIFIIKLFLTFIVGSLWITYATIIAEKLGSKIGGVLAGLPSTIVIGLFFIGWTQSPLIASRSTNIVPIMMGISSLFVVTYSFLLNYSFYIAVVISLVLWLILTFILVFFHFDNFTLSIISFFILLGLSFYIFEYVLKIKSSSKKIFKPTFSNLLFRGLLSGSIITISVILAKFGGPIIGGAFASFPAVFLSTMIITYIAQGKDFSRSVMKILMVSGTTNVVVYASSVKYSYPNLGLYFGTLFSFLISLISVNIIYFLVKKVS